MAVSRKCNNKHSPIIRQIAINNLTISSLCGMLGVTNKTIYKWVNSPRLITVGQLYAMAGIFKLDTYTFLYLLETNKPQATTDDKWYIEGLKTKASDYISIK